MGSESKEKFYALDSSETESSGDDDEKDETETIKAPKASKNKKSKSKETKIGSKIPVANIDYARGEVFMSDSSSEEEEDSSDEDANDQEIEESEGFDKWGELDHDAESTEEATKRLAICNMDWDRVR